MKKVVLKLELHDDKAKKKALKTVSSISGVESLSLNVKEKKLTVIGDVDPVALVSRVRKHLQADIISVGPAATPKKEKEEPKKEKAKKEEGNKEAEVFGRREERENLLERLLGYSSGVEASKLDIIPIVGLGGIGKTTLAQLVYDDERVRKHFDIKMWVRVSDAFDEVRVAKAIVEALGGKSSDSLEALLQSFYLFIRGKKFLLVLDDVWVVEERKWVQLKRHLEFGAKGSVILITARKESVAVMMSAETASMIRLQILPEKDCWDIFWQQASSGGDESEIQHLKDVGRQIALKCKGLPLLAKILGRLVHSKKTIAEWQEVLQSELWELGEEIETYIPLLLSYNDFSPLEKCCLLYCSVFPKGYEIDIDNLIDMWMSQGYLSGDENFEREGLSCFKQLAMRSFFQDFETDYNGNIIRCKMVEVVHDFVQFLAKDEFVILESAKKNITDQVINFQRARHVTCLIDKWIPPKEFCNKMKMHTLLFLHNSGHWHQDSVILQIDDIVEKQTLLRTLDLTSCYRIQLPVNIDKLMPLRYLNLSNNRVLEVLPDTLCNLFNLQTLRMSNCVKLRRLPEGIEKLVNLRHLYIDWCHSLEGLPKGIQKLTCLQTLAMYVVPDKNSPMDKEALKLRDLMNMKLVQRSLCISRCQNIANAHEAESAELRNNEYLESLWLQFGPLGIHGTDFGGKGEEERRILEALQPHRNLISLCVGSYGGNILPNWIMSLIHLKRLDLFHIPNCETLPPLGSLPSLEFLDIFGMEKMKSLGRSFLGEKTGITKEAMGWQNESSGFTSFPKLKELCFYSMESWEEWESIDSEEKYAISEIMPCLESLEFSNCPRLEALPDFLKMTPLQRLEISFSDILESRLSRGGKDWHKIGYIPSITIGERPIRSNYLDID